MNTVLAPHSEPDRESAIQRWRDDVDVFWKKWGYEEPAEPMTALWEGIPKKERTVSKMKERRGLLDLKNLQKQRDEFESGKRELEIRGSVLNLEDWAIESIMKFAREAPVRHTSQ